MAAFGPDADSSAHAQTWVLTGSVQDTAGSGIAEVDIDVSDDSGTPLSLAGDLTAADGSFSVTILDTVPLGFYDLEFNPPLGSDFADRIVTGVFLFDSADLGAFTLERRFTVQGVVIDADGLALEGMDLELFDASGVEVLVNNDNTDAFGSFSVDLLEGTYDIAFRQVDVVDVEYVPVLRPQLLVDADLDLGEIVLLAGYTVTGRVEDSSGTAVVGADLDVDDPVTGASLYTPNDDTDAGGDFTLLVTAGEWTFRADAPVGTLLAPASLTTTIAAPPPDNDIGVIVLPAGVEITGSVLDDAGTAVVGVDLDFIDTTTQLEVLASHDDSDVSGAFAAVVPAGTYDVRLRPAFTSGLAPAELDARDLTSSTDLGTIELADGLVLSGTVTGGGVPIAGVVVTLADATTGAAVYVFGNETDASGAYAFRAASDTYDVTFTPPLTSGFDALTNSDFVLTADAVLDAELDVGDPPPPPPPPAVEFVRGDANGSAPLDLSDAIFMLRWQFGDGTAPRCLDAADFNDDGSVNLADAIGVLGYLFTDGAPPDSPFPGCGTDAGTDSLDCESATSGC